MSPDLIAALGRLSHCPRRGWVMHQIHAIVNARLGREVSWHEVLELATADDIARAYAIRAPKVDGAALDVLESLASQPVGATLAWLAEETGRAATTVRNVLTTAHARGWVVRPTTGSWYRAVHTITPLGRLLVVERRREAA